MEGSPRSAPFACPEEASAEYEEGVIRDRIAMAACVERLDVAFEA